MSAQKRKQYPDTHGHNIANTKALKGKPDATHIDKKRKFQDAREISAQLAEDAFRDGQFNVASFVNSREYEIKSLLRSMNSSRSAQRKRAFQSLPREQRRRTAAHNPNRVPKRVRSTAKKEFVDDNTTLPKKRRDYRPQNRRLNNTQLRMLSSPKKETGNSKSPTLGKPGKNSGASRPLTKPSRFRKRQRHKTWLPSHIWCAKRARMIVKWGFSIAETPTLKCYRPTYRGATRDGCIAFDTSYMATLLLEGCEVDLKRCLMSFLPPKSLAIIGRNTVSGDRASSTWIYQVQKWPEGTIAPVWIFWCTEAELASGISQGNGSKKDKRQRKLVLRVHPAGFDEVLKIVSKAAESTSCSVQNLRFEIGSIRLVGPRIPVVLKSLLWPSGSQGFDFETEAINTVLYKTVLDPRLIDVYGSSSPSLTLDQSPTSHGLLFDKRVRIQAVKNQVSQKTLNARISKLKKESGDMPSPRDMAPIVLIKDTVGERNNVLKPEAAVNDSCTILLPWKWVRPFWLILMRRVGVRLGGLKELEQITLESCSGSYPMDFVATTAGREEAVKRFENDREQEKRRRGIKTRTSLKKSLRNEQVESQFGYPWDTVLGPIDTNDHDSLAIDVAEPQLWQMTPDLFQTFTQTPRHQVPKILSHAIFAVHIRIFGRGSADSNACVYSLPASGSRAYEKLKLQYTRDGKPIAAILNTTGSSDPAAISRMDSDPSFFKDNEGEGYPIGFVIRGNFGYFEGMSVATGALSWARTQDHGSKELYARSGWCIIQNKVKGLKRLAQWSAI